jgi:hypothetical protein
VKPRLHLDADASIKVLVNALCKGGHDVTRTPNEWMPADSDDRAQLLGATAQGRILFTFNVRDFLTLVKKYPRHSGILLATQSRLRLAELTAALDRVLSTTDEDDWRGQVRWLNDFR